MMKTGLEEYRLLEEDSQFEDWTHPTTTKHHSGRHEPQYKLVLLTGLVISLGFNMLMGVRFLQGGTTNTGRVPDKSPFAGLIYDTIMQDDHGGLYNSPNETLTNEAWELLSSDHGSIALTNEYAASMGLPPAQPFPWDDSKSIYFINAYHSIHCLKLMRRSLLELRDNLPLSLPLHHTLHCFNALRQDIICAADDTPRKTSFDHPGTIGVGQERTCRSWDQLEKWAKERTACWRNINDSESIDTLLRYRYCSRESPYYERIHEIFGGFEMGDKASATT